MRIAFCGHSYHRTTGSSAFFLEALRAHGAVEELWDESWITGTPLDVAPIASAGFDAVVVWQVEEVARRLAEHRLPNVSFFPMYDACHAMPDAYWRGLGDVKVVCFSSTLHERIQRLGVRSRFVRYFPDPDRLVPPARSERGLAGYFWQRQQDVTWTTIRALLGDADFRRFTLHRATDPSLGRFVAPSPEDVERYRIRVTDWFPSRHDALADVLQHNVYFAPRLREGIGMSFLEAMATGFLVVAPDHPTMNEYIVPGVNGLLYDPLDPRPLDFSRRELMAGRARRSIEAGWRKWRRSADALFAFVLEPGGARPARAPFDALDPLAFAREVSVPGNGVTPAAGARVPPRTRAADAAAPEGGRRLRDGMRADDGASPLVTVAVVTRNAEAMLAPTLDSILAQDYPHREVVVLDGASTDGTVGVLERYDHELDYWRSEKDAGPYHAMNAAARVAAGRYVIFMNAGDWFHAADSLSAAVEGAPADADVIFGHHVYRDLTGHDELHAAADFDETWARLREGRIGWRWLSRVPGHQATLTRTELLRRNPYRSDLRIAADHELLYRFARQGARFHHAAAVIATYVGGGLSSRNESRCMEEWRRIALEYTERPELVARTFAHMLDDMRRSELPRIPTSRLLLRIGRVPGATRELKRRLRTRFARARAAPPGPA